MTTVRKTIGLTDIRALTPNSLIWDAKVQGFGARRQKSAAVSYLVFYRTKEGRQRFHTIGRHGAPWTPDTARAEAKRILGEVVAGRDPAGEKLAARRAETVAELCDEYFEAASTGRLLIRNGRAKKASTLASDRARIERHIKPLVGQLKVASVTKKDVDNFLHAVAAGKTAAAVGRPQNSKGGASRTLALLSAIFAFAVAREMRETNPCAGVLAFATIHRERRLTDEEYARLGAALDAKQPFDNVIRFLALTGWRRGEALALRHSEVDLDKRTATLGDTKTGKSVRPLSLAACDFLRALPPRPGELVFPSASGDRPIGGASRAWLRFAARAGLPKDISPHTLRHSFASTAADLGYSEFTVAALLGHRAGSVTSKYVHSADSVLLAAADAVASSIGERMGCKR